MSAVEFISNSDIFNFLSLFLIHCVGQNLRYHFSRDIFKFLTNFLCKIFMVLQ